MTAATGYCPNCGAPVQPQAGFCGNCGTKIGPTTASSYQAPPAYYPPAALPQPHVSTGAYKATIAVLLVIIILLGIGLYATSSSGHLFPFGPSRYNLTNPPNFQSTQPPPAHTSQNPQYIIWNSCGSGPCTMTANGWREGSVPDTFDYYVSFTSTVNITVYFFTMGQFVQFSVCNGDIRCVSPYYDIINATTNVPQYTVFTLGEGCADYLAVYVASGAGTMTPSVGVTRPAVPPNSPTGYCGQVGSG